MALLLVDPVGRGGAWPLPFDRVLSSRAGLFLEAAEPGSAPRWGRRDADAADRVRRETDGCIEEALQEQPLANPPLPFR